MFWLMGRTWLISAGNFDVETLMMSCQNVSGTDSVNTTLRTHAVCSSTTPVTLFTMQS